MRDDDRCYWHSQKPEIVAKRAKGARRGGARGKLPVQVVDIQSIEDVRRILSQALSELLSCATDSIPAKARAVGYLCSICLVALEKGDLEERVSRLEERLNEETT